ncbi:hypothetical protein Mithridates_00052 [Acinetobacter phage Mithridates]|nr:hypothetical protein Mithridates_00052 [Acinetobacter phage Mithridates]
MFDLKTTGNLARLHTQLHSLHIRLERLKIERDVFADKDKYDKLIEETNLEINEVISDIMDNNIFEG